MRRPRVSWQGLLEPSQANHRYRRPRRHKPDHPAESDRARLAAALLVAVTLAHGLAVAWLLGHPPRMSTGGAALGTMQHSRIGDQAHPATFPSPATPRKQ